MEIRFSDNWARTHAYPEDVAKRAARTAGCHWTMKWADDSATRGRLVETIGSFVFVDDAHHRAFALAVFSEDPHAEIRTAKAIYRGLEDFNKQNA